MDKDEIYKFLNKYEVPFLYVIIVIVVFIVIGSTVASLPDKCDKYRELIIEQVIEQNETMDVIFVIENRDIKKYVLDDACIGG